MHKKRNQKVLEIKKTLYICSPLEITDCFFIKTADIAQLARAADL